MPKQTQLPTTGMPGLNPDDGTVIEDGAYTVDGEYHDAETARVLRENDEMTAGYDPRTDSQYADYEEDYTDGVDLHEFDNDLPIIEIIQPQTGDMGGGEQGQFIRRDTGEVFSEIDIVPLAVRANRTAWPAKFSRSSFPTCFSPNGITYQHHHARTRSIAVVRMIRVAS